MSLGETKPDLAEVYNQFVVIDWQIIMYMNKVYLRLMRMAHLIPSSSPHFPNSCSADYL